MPIDTPALDHGAHYHAGIREGLLRFLGVCGDMDEPTRRKLIEIHARLRCEAFAEERDERQAAEFRRIEAEK